MGAYIIEAQDGTVFGLYQGATAAEAWRAMVDAGAAGDDEMAGTPDDWYIWPASVVECGQIVCAVVFFAMGATWLYRLDRSDGSLELARMVPGDWRQELEEAGRRSLLDADAAALRASLA